jgi:acyl-coenzyme A thioesterase PaaI-like protein
VSSETQQKEQDRDELLRSGFLPLNQAGTFLDHVGGMMWRRLPDRTDTCLILEPRHLNPNGTAHGGLLMTLLDITLGATVESYLQCVGSDRHPITIQLSCSMMSPALRDSVVFGEAEVEQSTRVVSFVKGQLVSAGRTLLTASAVFRNPPPPAS